MEKIIKIFNRNKYLKIYVIEFNKNINLEWNKGSNVNIKKRLEKSYFFCISFMFFNTQETPPSQ